MHVFVFYPQWSPEKKLSLLSPVSSTKFCVFLINCHVEHKQTKQKMHIMSVIVAWGDNEVNTGGPAEVSLNL